jgi:hypothetical protein
MAVKTHLVSQEENVSESGIQLRNDEPSSPVDQQIWIRKDLKRLKAFVNGQVVVLAKGDPFSALISGVNIDYAVSQSFYKTVSTSTQFNLMNLSAGDRIDFTITNNGASSINVTFIQEVLFADGTNGTIAASQTKLFTVLRVDTRIVVRASTFA